MKSTWKMFLGLTIFALLLTACAPAATPAPAPTAVPTAAPTLAPTDVPAPVFTDGLGRSVQLESTPQRIISMAPSNTEILFAVGAGAQVIARDDLSDTPEAAQALPSVGGFSGYNVEQMVALKPDLVLAAEINTPEQVKAMEDAGLTVNYLSNPKDFEGLYANLTLVGQLSGHESEAAALNESLKARVQAVTEVAAQAKETPSVFYELDSTNPAKPWTSGPGTFVDLIIRMAGGRNVGAELDAEWAQISQEALIVADPDYILMGDAMWGVTAEQVAARPGWGGLKAVQSQKVLPFDDNLVSRPGPRLVDGLEAMLKIFHPELVK